MRFAFCIFKYFPYGGIQRDLLKVVRECRARGHAVKVFTLRWEANPVDDLDVEVIPIVGLNRHSQYGHFAEAVAQAVENDNFDLIVGFNKMPGLDVYYAGDSCYVEKAMEQRSSWYRLLPRYKSFFRAERAVFDRASNTQILVLSNVEIPRYRHHYQTAPERFHLLPPGIERDRIAPEDREARRAHFLREHGLADDTLVLLFIGSGFIKKGLDRALLSLGALPREVRDRVHFFVIGRDKAEAFERMAMRMDLTKQVTFFADGREDVPHFLFAADALIHPAYDETAGMVIIEAMLAGVPTVVTRNCGYARYLEEHDAGIVLPQPFSQEQLNEALLEILTSDKRHVWRANGMAAKQDEDLFNLVPRAVDYLEQFARARKPLLIFALFRYFPYGGLQRDFMRVALACRDRGYRILVYCLWWQGEVPDGFDVIEVDAAGVANHTKYQRFAEHVERDAMWRKAEAVIGFNKMPGLDFYYAADPCFEHKAQQMRSGLYRRTERYRLMSRFERAVFSPDAPTKIMLIAPDQQEQFVRYYGTQLERLCLLPPGVSRDRARGDDWRVQRAAIRAEFGVAEDEFLLLLVGSGFITKGLDRFLHAVAALPEALGKRCRLLVIGQDNPNQFVRLARSLDLAERVDIVKGRDDIPAVLQGADLMVHPAYMESGGMVLIEAIIAGLPVIASGVCGFANYIDEAQAGIVLREPFDQSELTDSIRRVLEDDACRSQWSENGVRFGQTRTDLYDMPRHALNYIEGSLEEWLRESA